MRTSIIALALLASAASLSAVQAKEGVELGMLDCVVAGGAGFVIGSTKDVTCTYQPAGDGLAPETYIGSIEKIGLDIGVTDKTMIQWLVLGPNNDVYAPGALAGNYAGVSADASVAVGGGANLLVGGSAQSFTLQPLSVQAQTGLNLAVGVTDFKLRAAQ